MSPSFPASAPFPAIDPAVEYGDDDIDDVLAADHNEPNGINRCRNRVVISLQLQDKQQKMRSAERTKKKSAGTMRAVKISLYDGSVADSNYNHLDPSKHIIERACGVVNIA